MDESASAFVPGHVTGFFTVEPDEDPTRAGSTGAGVALAEGVTVEVRPASETTVLLNDDPVRVQAVERVLKALSVRATVEADTSLPLGAGFGVSGAMALGTALAANAVFETGLSENELVTIAHGAEVQSGTGLGDVVAQARGGVPIRLEPGSPNHGKLDGIPTRGRIEYLSFGELDTRSVVGGDTEQLTEAGEKALSRVVREPTFEQFTYASRRFAREAGLLTEDVGTAIAEVNDAGGEASMAMLGDTVFALGTALSDVGYEAETTSVHLGGASIE